MTLDEALKELMWKADALNSAIKEYQRTPAQTRKRNEKMKFLDIKNKELEALQDNIERRFPSLFPNG